GHELERVDAARRRAERVAELADRILEEPHLAVRDAEVEVRLDVVLAERLGDAALELAEQRREAVVVGRTARARLRERLRQLGRQAERGARAVGPLREAARRARGLVGGRRRGRRLGGDTDRRRRRRRRARRRGRSLRGGRRAQRGVVGGPARRAEAGGGGVVAGGGRVRGPGPRRIVERGRGEVERVG